MNPALLRLLGARAATLSTSLSLVLHGVEHLQEGRLGHRHAGGGGLAGVVGLHDGDLGRGGGASAALRLLLLASGLLALQLALGARAVGGLGALVGALQLLAHGRALGLGGRAGGVALGRGADGLALGAVLLLAEVLGAADRASGALAVHDALRALNLHGVKTEHD